MATFKQYTSKKTGGAYWMFKTYLGIDPATGRQVTTSRRSFRTKKEAVLAEKRLQVEYEQNNGLIRQATNTYREIYELWFETYVKTVKETTSLTTEIIFNSHILPTLGSMKVAKIDVKTCQRVVNVWEENPNSCAKYISHASRIMKYALNMSLISFNPFDRIIRSIRKETAEKKLKFYTRDQLETILIFQDRQVELCKNQPLVKQFYPFWCKTYIRLLAFSGMRAGEALALNFSDIDFKNATVTISKTISDSKAGITISSPKTKSSNRIVPLDEKTLQILKKWQLKQREILFSNRVRNSSLVFPTITGQLQTRNRALYKVNRLAFQAGLPNIGLHGYRHTHASLLFEAGATMKEVQVRLGHCNIEMTMNVYTHVTEKVKAQTVEKLVKFAGF